MKKIIAAAVATAFVAPAFAADVTISGEVEYTITNADGLNTFGNGTQDFTITASEELANGLSVSAFLRNDTGGADQAGEAEVDSAVTISGGFGSLQIGKDATQAGGAYDDKSDVASGGAAADGEINDGVAAIGHVTFMPNTGIDGLDLAIGMSAGDATNEEVVSYAVQYSVGGIALAYGATDTDLATDKTATVLSASFASGPIYVGIDSQKNMGGVDGTDAIGVGVTYTMGNVTLEVERMSNKHASNVDTTDTVYGANYDVGSGLEVYIAAQTDEGGTSTRTSTDSTIVGVEYKF